MISSVPFALYDFFGYLASGTVVLVLLQEFVAIPIVLGHDHTPAEGAVLLLAVYVAGHVVAGLAKPLLEDFLVHGVLKSPSIRLMSDSDTGFGRRLFPGYSKPLPPAVRERIRARARREGNETSGEALFLWIRFNSESTGDSVLQVRLSTFVAQYGFARNICFAFAIAGLALLGSSFWNPAGHRMAFGTSALAVAVAMWYRFLKFYRQYSFELFNCYGARP